MRIEDRTVLVEMGAAGGGLTADELGLVYPLALAVPALTIDSALALVDDLGDRLERGQLG